MRIPSSNHEPSSRLRHVARSAVATMLLSTLLVSCGGRQAAGGGGSDTSTDWVRMCRVQSECDATTDIDLACECGVCTSECQTDADCDSVAENAVCSTTPDACGGRRVCAPPAFDGWQAPARGVREGDPCSPSDDTCGAGLVCAASTCGDQGTCTLAGDGECPANYAPVCGCDGTTHGNSCSAGRAPIDYEGRCIGEQNPCVVAIDATQCCGEVVAASAEQIDMDSCLVEASGAVLAEIEQLTASCHRGGGCPEVACPPLEVREEIASVAVHVGGGVCELKPEEEVECVVAVDTKVCCAAFVPASRADLDADPCLLDLAQTTVEEVAASQTRCVPSDQCSGVSCAGLASLFERDVQPTRDANGECALSLPDDDECIKALDLRDCCGELVATTRGEMRSDPCLVDAALTVEEIEQARLDCVEPGRCDGALCVPHEERWELDVARVGGSGDTCMLEYPDRRPAIECVVAVNQWECCSPIIAVDARVAAADECVVGVATADPETSFDETFCGLPCPAQCTAPQSRPEYGAVAVEVDGECVLEPECTDNTCAYGPCDPRVGCADGLVCQSSSCDDEGLCALPWPLECPAGGDVVCGCDGTAYVNECTAVGAAIDRDVACFAE